MDLSKKILSDIIVFSKYAKYMPELKRRETWDEIVNRNVMMHIKKYPHMTEEISRAFQYVYEKKVLPSMRMAQFSGKAIEVGPHRGYNCSFVNIDTWEVFHEIMFLLLGGTGVGYSVQRHHIEKLPTIKRPLKRKRRHLVADSIEGFSDSVKVLMKAYFFNESDPVFDFSVVRPKGSPIRTSGGKAPGPQPLKDCLHNIRKVLDTKEPGSKLSSIEVHDIVCHIADSVLSGGIRRSACLSLFSLDDEEMMTCKFGDWWETNPQRGRANNSVMLLRHKVKKEDFDCLWKKVKESRSGEPGVRLSNNSEQGTNPCAEISLKSAQYCNLSTINVTDVDSQQELNDRARAASFIGTLQAGYTDFHYIRESWKENTEKESLLGISMAGIASGNVLKLDLAEAAKEAKKENKRVAKLIGINQAYRLSCVKPEGSTSLLLGTSSGIHAWHSAYYIRRITLMKNEPLYTHLRDKLPELLEDDILKPHSQAFLKLPIRAPDGAITRKESATELLERVKKVYKEWIIPGHSKGDDTHNVSATITVKEDEWEQVGEWMWDNRDFYCGLSVLPEDLGTYSQTPFEECTKKQYEELMQYVKDIDLTKITESDDATDLKGEVACGGGNCEVK